MWFSNFEIVLEDRVLERGSLRTEGDTIAEIVEHTVKGAAVDGDGRLLLPGFVDLHGDMIEKEVEPRPNVRMPLELGVFDLDRKLASCGITTAFAALSFQPAFYGHVRSVDLTIAMIEAIIAMRPRLLVDHRIHARFEVTFPDALATAERLAACGALGLISLMDHTPGQGQYRDIERHVASIAKQRGVSETEAAGLVAEKISGGSEGNSMQIVEDLARLARDKGVALASHDDDTVEKVALMHGLGAVISEFPITVGAAQEARRRSMATVMGAPNALRGLSYSGNLSAREAFDAGLLDVLASDYHPSAMLPAAVTLADLGSRSLASAVSLISANPARVAGLADRGRIALGLRADLVIAERGSIPRMRATLRGGKTIWGDGTIGRI